MVKWCATRSSYGCVFVTSDVFSSVGWIWQQGDWIYCTMPHYLWQSFSNLSKKQFTLSLLVCNECSKIVSDDCSYRAVTHANPCPLQKAPTMRIWTSNWHQRVKKVAWEQHALWGHAKPEWCFLGNVLLVLTWSPTFPHLDRIEHLWYILNKQLFSVGAFSCNWQSVKDLLLRSLYQIPSEV